MLGSAVRLSYVGHFPDNMQIYRQCC